MKTSVSTILMSVAAANALAITRSATCETDPKAVSACTNGAISDILSQIAPTDIVLTKGNSCTKLASGPKASDVCTLSLCATTDTDLSTDGESGIDAVHQLQSRCSSHDRTQPKTAGGKFNYEGELGYLWLVDTDQN